VGQVVDRDWMPIPQKVQTVLENNGAEINAITFKDLICFILHYITAKSLARNNNCKNLK
jgi:hypothetical protein